MTFGESLKRFRQSLGLNQKELSDELNMKPPLYQRYESGKTTPSVDFVYKLISKYGVSADYLLGLTDSPHPTPYDEKEVKAAFEFRDAWLRMQQAQRTVMNAGQVPAQ